jgi:hypothetical protein
MWARFCAVRSRRKWSRLNPAEAAVGPEKKKAGPKARHKVEVRQKVKTFQRERPTRHRREEDSDTALKSAAAHIDCITPLCNAACLMKGLR